jgi:SPOR domain
MPGTGCLAPSKVAGAGHKAGLVLALVFGAGQALAEGGPSPPPPADYLGEQFVDSQGCLYLRAGRPGETVWIPRVSRGGAPMCGYPPSGSRVAVEGGDGATAATNDTASNDAPQAMSEPVVSLAGHLVAVGAFGNASNADKAVARLGALAYPSRRGLMPGDPSGLIVVLAGPFGSARDARRAARELRGAGFPDAAVLTP